MVVAVKGGVVKAAPVNTGVPPVGTVYQLKIVLATAVAVKVAVVPEHIWVVLVTVPFMVTTGLGIICCAS